MIYTDGAAKGNPGRGGWGAVVMKYEPIPCDDGPEVLYGGVCQPPRCEVIKEIGGRSKRATNNQMELSAAIQALEYIKKEKIILPIEIYSDSKYVIFGITKWIDNWLKNNWRNAAKKPVLNRGLWEELHALVSELKPALYYVEGHTGDMYNERADEIASAFAEGTEKEINMKMT